MNSTKYPPVVVVDENDNEIGSAPLMEVWQKGLCHRIVSIFVQDSEGRMLLQLRGSNVKVYPDCWDQAAGGHVDQGFSYDEAARQELAEELGIEGVELTPLGTFRTHNELDDGRIVNQFERAYVVKIPVDTTIIPQVDEIRKVQWFTPSELQALIDQHPECCTSGLVYSLHTYFSAFGL